MKVTTVKISETEDISLGELSLDQAEAIFTPNKPAGLANREMVVQCIKNGSAADFSNEEVGKMSWTNYRKIFDACLELNGFKQAEGSKVPSGAEPSGETVATKA